MSNFINKVKKSNTTYHRWKWFAYSYLALAEVGLEKLEEEVNNPDRIKDIKHYFVFNKRYLFIPIIFNFKHSIEIILKGLKIQDNNEYIQTHDNEILKSIPNKTIKKQDFDNLNKIAGKYYKVEFFDKALINSIEISDKHNDIFRFPENSASFFLDSECFGSFTKDKLNKFLNELKEDINSVFELLLTISNDISNSKKTKENKKK